MAEYRLVIPSLDAKVGPWRRWFGRTFITIGFYLLGYKSWHHEEPL